MSYTPRRMPKRFLDGAPAGILDIFDNGAETFDRFTVVYNYPEEDRGTVYLPYRGMSEHPTAPNGFGISDTFTRWELASYRDAYRGDRIRWDELPPDVQKVASRDCSMFEEG